MGTALVTAALLEKKASLKQLIKSWTVSYSGNLVGSILLASMVATGGTLGPLGGASVGTSVANMFIIPLGIMSGAAVSWNTFFLKNLIPVTLGNIVGGAVFVASAFSYTYGALGKK